ncbi:MAG TPA: hypothetical protein VJ843_03895 [Candidatus Saccharimonadales bacterium]|nr:hypothetical protein [Candidatus Saccharimonadales bacterium]
MSHHHAARNFWGGIMILGGVVSTFLAYPMGHTWSMAAGGLAAVLLGSLLTR